MVRFYTPVLAILGTLFLLDSCAPPVSLQEFRNAKNWIGVESIVISGAPNILYWGGPSVQLYAEVSPVNASSSKITWSIDPSGANWAEISSTGLLSAIDGYYDYRTSATITATSVDHPDIKSSVTVSILNGHLRELSLGSGELKFNLDSQPITLPVTSVPAVAPLPDLTWTSSNAQVASVSADGKLTPHAIGTTTVSANGGGFSISKMVTIVASGMVTRVTVTPSLELKIGDLGEIQKVANATVWPENATDKSITWSSSNNSIATVDADGKVTAIDPGTTTIYARSHADSTIFATCEVTVGVAASPVQPVTLPMQEIVEMAYSRALDRVIMLQKSPARIILYDPVSNQSLYRDLTQIPLGVGISPNGLRAVVGFDGAVELFDLSLEGFSLPVHWNAAKQSGYGVNRGDLKCVNVTDDGMIYAIDGSDQWIDLRRINGVTGVESFLFTMPLRAGDRGKIHSGNKTFYYLDYGSLYAVDVSDSDSSEVPNYSGGGNVGYDFWFFDHGNAVLGSSGGVFEVTQDPTTDITPLGNLSISHITSADHSTAAIQEGSTGILAATGSYTISWFDDDTFELKRSVALPSYQSDSGTFYWYGKYAFWNSKGDQLYILMNKTESSEDGWAIATF